MTTRSRTVRYARALVSTRTVRAVVATAALVLGTCFAHASDDDFDFAQALAARGYGDLAEAQFRKILNDPSRSASEKAEGQYGLALIKFTAALRDANVENDARRKGMPIVLAAFDAADKELTQFLQRNPTHSRALDAKLSNAKVQTEKADYVNRAIERGWLTPDLDESKLKQQVAAGYDQAIKLLKTVQDDIKIRLVKLSPSDDGYEETSNEHGLVWLYKIQALYGKGAALPKGDASGIASLNMVLTEVENFLWDYEGTVRGLWGFYFSGLANWKLGNPKDAMNDITSAATSADEKQAIPGSLSIVMMSFQKAAEMGPDLADSHGPQYLERTAKLFDKLPQTWPSYLQTAYGQRAALAHAKILALQGQTAEAIELVQTVIRKADEHGTFVQNDGGRVLGELLTGGTSGAALDPALLDRIASSKFAGADYRGAVKAYQAVVQASRGDNAMMDAHGWRAWERIGNSYGALERFYEAYVAFDHLQIAYRADNTNEVLEGITNTTGFSRAQVIDLLARNEKDETKKTALVAHSKKLLEEFASDNPNSPKNQDAASGAFSSKMKEMKQAAREGDMPKARALAKEARALAGSIAPDSKTFDRVGADLASIHLHLKEYDQGIKESQKWLDKERPTTIDSAVRRARRQGAAISLSTLLGCYSRRPDSLEGEAKKTAFTELLAVIDKHGAQYAEITTRGKRQMDTWRIEALNELGQVDQADELLGNLLEADANLRNGPFLALLVARAREREGAEWEAKTDMQRARVKYRRAAQLYEYAATKGAEFQGRVPSPGSFRSIAKKWIRAGELDKGEELLKKALEAYEAAGEQESADAVRIELIGLFIDRGKYDEAIGPLESRLVEDETSRTAVLTKLGEATGKLTNADIEELQTKHLMSKQKGVIDQLSRAYFEAAREDFELIRAINLVNLLQFATRKDDQHNERWIEWKLREVKAYYKFGENHGAPDAFKTCAKIIQNLVTLGMLEQYDKTVPGSKAQFEAILRDAKAKS